MVKDINKVSHFLFKKIVFLNFLIFSRPMICCMRMNASQHILHVCIISSPRTSNNIKFLNSSSYEGIVEESISNQSLPFRKHYFRFKIFKTQTQTPRSDILMLSIMINYTSPRLGNFSINTGFHNN